MAKTLACRDMGVDCNWAETAPDIDRLIEAATDHTKQVHGIKEVPGEMVASMKRAVRDV